MMPRIFKYDTNGPKKLLCASSFAVGMIRPKARGANEERGLTLFRFEVRCAM